MSTMQSRAVIQQERAAEYGWGPLFVVLAGTFMTFLDFFIVNVALPSVQHDLHAGPAAIQLVVAGYGLTFAAGMITGGRLGDLYGRRRMFAIGLALFTVTSAACGLAPSATFLVIARVAAGRRRRDDDAAGAGHPRHRLQRRASGEGVRHLRHGHGHRRGARPVARRAAHPGRRRRVQLARHLPDQRAGRHRGSAAGRAGRPGVARRTIAARPVRHRAGYAGAGRLLLRARPVPAGRPGVLRPVFRRRLHRRRRGLLRGDAAHPGDDHATRQADPRTGRACHRGWKRAHGPDPRAPPRRASCCRGWR